MNLEENILAWRKQMLAAGIKTPAPLEELENHLRDAIDRQVRSGLGEQGAFAAVCQTNWPAKHPGTRIQKNRKGHYDEHYETNRRRCVGNPQSIARNGIYSGRADQTQKSGNLELRNRMANCSGYHYHTDRALARPFSDSKGAKPSCAPPETFQLRRRLAAETGNGGDLFQRRQFSTAAPSRIFSAAPPCAARRCREIRPARSRKSF